MHAERRTLRSNDPSRAIRIFLAKNAGDSGLRAAVVASNDGLLLGGVGEDLEAVAALGSAMSSGIDVSRRCTDQGWSDQALFTTPLEVDGERFTVSSLGAPLTSSQGVGQLLGRLLA